MTTEETIRQAIRSTIGCEEEELKPEARLVEDLGFDSFDLVELLLELEEHLEIEIDDDTAAKLNTVGDVIAYFNSLKAGL